MTLRFWVRTPGALLLCAAARCAKVALDEKRPKGEREDYARAARFLADRLRGGGLVMAGWAQETAEEGQVAL